MDNSFDECNEGFKRNAEVLLADCDEEDGGRQGAAEGFEDVVAESPVVLRDESDSKVAELFTP